MIQTIQKELETTRISLYKIIHSVVATASCREPTLDYIATLLRYNEKRAQMRTEEFQLASDGFALNLLSVLQMLSVKIKLDTVDTMYPFHSNSLVKFKKDETRLKLTSQEVSFMIAF